MSLIRRPRRPGRAVMVLAIVALFSATGRLLWANGLFSSMTPGYGGACKSVATLAGVQDMEAANGTVFVSVAGKAPSAADGIYALPVTGGVPAKLVGAPKDFHPRGIGLFHTPDGKGLFLFAVNHHAGASARAGATKDEGRFSIDSFEVTDPATAPKLVAQGTVEGGLMINPQDVAAVSPTAFYVANGTASKYAPIHWLQTYGVISGGDVLFFNGTSFREAIDGLYGTRSILVAGDRVIVGGLLSHSLSSFAREDLTGNLTDEQDINLPAGPEKLSRDQVGDIWAAGHANLFDLRSAGPGKPATSQVFHVGLADKLVQQVYGNSGAEISGASVALPVGSRLLIGSPIDGKLLDCGTK